jgi:hypothetical protein
VVAAIDLDLGALSARLGARRRQDKWVGAVMLLLVILMSTMYVTSAVGFAVTGQQPTDVLPMPPPRVQLAYALDLTLLMPTLVCAAVLLWRRTRPATRSASPRASPWAPTS